MRQFQVWIAGSSLYDVPAESEKEALQYMREWLEVKRLPNGTFACEIPSGYYNAMVRNNQEIGIDISNM